MPLEDNVEPTAQTSLEALEQRTSSDWSHLRQARIQSARERATLTEALSDYSNRDASIIVVGSLAREEFTCGSDVDWALLVDGISFPEDLETSFSVRKALDRLERKQPGREGIFGTIVSSHNLVHNIGGQDDTNANTTLRILLLLESLAIGNPDAHRRVINNILFRYLNEDRGLWHGSGRYKVPRFMFNDIARYWRTMAVDFAYKQRNRENVGFAIRNFKLRMSRKLMFLAGMIACFECHTSFNNIEDRTSFYSEGRVQSVIDLLVTVLSKAPLEIIATALAREQSLDEPAKALFTAYDEFIGLMADDTPLANGNTRRKQLDLISVGELEDDPTAKLSRDISHRFRDAIESIFLRSDTDISRLTIEYGVF